MAYEDTKRWETHRGGRRKEVGDAKRWKTQRGGRHKEVEATKRWKTQRGGRHKEVGATERWHLRRPEVAFKETGHRDDLATAARATDPRTYACPKDPLN